MTSTGPATGSSSGSPCRPPTCCGAGREGDTYGAETAAPRRLPVRPWTAGVGVLASHRARVVESADRPSEDRGRDDGRNQGPGRCPPGRPRRGRAGRDRAGGGGEGVHRRRPRRQGRRAGGSPDRRGRVLLAAGPVGLRQDHHPADDRRLRGADQRPDPPPRPRHGRRPAVPARRQHGLPAVRALPHMDVFENVAFGLRRKKVDKAEIARRVAEALALVELEGREKRKPRQLSGGQQQRVALARALVNQPRALLLDEPLGALDLKLRQAMQLELKRIQREVGITFVYVTHDQEEALTMSDRLVVMNAGRIEQLGSPRELYEHPHPVRGQLHRDLERPHRPAGAQGRRLGPGGLGRTSGCWSPTPARPGRPGRRAGRPAREDRAADRAGPTPPDAAPSGSRSTRSSTWAPRPSTARSPMAATPSPCTVRTRPPPRSGRARRPGGMAGMAAGALLCARRRHQGGNSAVTRNRPLDPAWLRGMTMPGSAAATPCGAPACSAPPPSWPPAAWRDLERRAPQASGFWASQTKAGQLDFANWPLYMDTPRSAARTSPLAPGVHQGDGDQGQLQGGHRGQRLLPGQDQPLAPGRPGPRVGPDRDHRRRVDREADPPELPHRARPLQAAQLRQERRPRGQEPELRPGQQVHPGLAVGPGRAGLQPQADQAGDHQLPGPLRPGLQGQDHRVRRRHRLPDDGHDRARHRSGQSTEEDWKRAAEG